MTQEEKFLLLQDLSARLPYGVIVDYKEHEHDIRHWKIDSLHTPTYSESGILIDTDYEGWIHFTEYKGCGMSTGSRPLHIEKNLPFLRSMSSMTEEERKEYLHITLCDFIDCEAWNEVDWLNKNMFDYRGLIPMGLALEAKEGMYKFKEK